MGIYFEKHYSIKIISVYMGQLFECVRKYHDISNSRLAL
jgi:hypothetical protein